MTPSLVLGVTGSRLATSPEHRRIINDTLTRIAVKYPPNRGRLWQLYHGDAPGSDSAAADICYDRGYCWSDGIYAIPADWKRHGHGAGPRRNQSLVKAVLGWRDTCAVGWVAFPAADDYAKFRETGKTNSSGSCDCIQRAEAAGIKLIVVPLDVSMERQKVRGYDEVSSDKKREPPLESRRTADEEDERTAGAVDL